MTLAIVHSRACTGVDAQPVTIEIHLSNGLPGLSIVGLPAKAVKESKDRVRSAIINSEFKFPSRRITVNLAPADLPKEGGRFDLPIALGILAASKQIPRQRLANIEFAGELALSGSLRRIQGALPLSLGACRAKRHLVVPTENGHEAALPRESVVLPAEHLLEVCGHLTGYKPLEALPPQCLPIHRDDDLDFVDVRGQPQAKRALEIAAAGQHSLLLVGPPGTGKTMLASRLPGILPTMPESEALESAAIRSISTQGFDASDWCKRPFRSPHHSASSVALVGGGSPPRPGEISLAHRGVLFLDELPEFSRHVLEALREPLESGHVTISRAAHQVTFPAGFQLVAAMNPCPCGYLGDADACCTCTSEQVNRYQAKISGPLLDRIDLHIKVPRLPKGLLTEQSSEDPETSHQVRKRVEAARQRQLARANQANAVLTTASIKSFCALKSSDRYLLEEAMQRMSLSARAHHRILRVSRTIADLASCDRIQTEHLMEALSYR